MFSKACEYGIRAVFFIAKQSHKGLRSNISEIAKAVDSPEPFTAKICQELARGKIILSKKGPNGGFYLKKDAEIKLSQIVKAIDGDQIFTSCALGLNSCSSANPCPLHNQFVDVRNGLKKMCENTLVMELAPEIEANEFYLKI